MKLKTYQAWTMAEALAFVKKDLGADAVILHTRTFDRGGFFGFGRKAVVEITAARAADMPAVAPTPARVGASRESNREASRAAVIQSRVTSNAHARVASTAVAFDSSPRPTAVASTDRVQFSAAARAYGNGVGNTTTASVVASKADDGKWPMPPFKAARESTAAATPVNGSIVTGNGWAIDTNLDMEAEREKTRRLAQAMSIQLERQAKVLAATAENEAATAQARAIATPHQTPATSGPAQRYVLMPEATRANGGGVQRMTAAIVQEIAPVANVPLAAVASDNSLKSIAQPLAQVVVVAAPDAVSPNAVSSASSTLSAATRTLSTAKPSSDRSSSNIASELDGIAAFVGRVLDRDSTRDRVVTHSSEITPLTRASRTPRGESLENAYARLIEQEVGAALAERIMHDVESEFIALRDAGSSPTAHEVREAVERRIAALLPDDELDAFAVAPGRHGARRIAFVGPTGVGKTTTLAKVAAQLRLKRGLRVGIVAADTYRIAAVDQLRTYAEILGIPMEIATAPCDAARACERLGDVDVILIDTAGRSQNDRMKLSELRAFLLAAAPDETHLVLSATASARALAKEAEAFGALGIDRIALTKLDEAASFGTLIELASRLGKRVSFLTHGQEVPDHIELARGRRLAALVMGSEVR